MTARQVSLRHAYQRPSLSVVDVAQPLGAPPDSASIGCATIGSCAFTDRQALVCAAINAGGRGIGVSAFGRCNALSATLIPVDYALDRNPLCKCTVTMVRMWAVPRLSVCRVM
jgi:hypothetical protein